MNAHLKGLLLGLGATSLFASFYPASRALLGDAADTLDPLSLSWLRFAFAVLFLFPLVAKRSNFKKLRSNWHQDWKMYLALGLIGIVGEGVLIFVAGKYTTAGRCTLLANASPIFTALLSFLFLHELLNGRKILGMVLGFAGISLVILAQPGQDMFGTSPQAIWGDLMALASGMCWATYTVMGERMVRTYGGMFGTFIAYCVGLVLMVPILLILDRSWDFSFSWRVWLGIAYIGGLTNGIANALWFKALNYLKPGALGALGYYSAFLAITFSTIFLHEKIGWTFVLSLIMVLGGVYLMMKPVVPAKK